MNIGYNLLVIFVQSHVHLLFQENVLSSSLQTKGYDGSRCYVLWCWQSKVVEAMICVHCSLFTEGPKICGCTLVSLSRPHLLVLCPCRKYVAGTKHQNSTLYMYLFWHTVTLAIINACLLYRQDCRLLVCSAF